VTGGSRGIGAETARLAAGRGYAVAVNYRENRAAAESLVKGLGGNSIAVQGDVAAEADVVRLFETVDRELGRVTALVNNAGIVDRGMRVAEMTAARIARMFAVNVTGSFLCAREAIDTFTIGLAKELGGEGIRVNAVRPGIIRTEIHLSSGDPARVERIGAMAPLRRAGEALEVAHAILWLLSDEASYMTGALVDVTGGR